MAGKRCIIPVPRRFLGMLLLGLAAALTLLFLALAPQRGSSAAPGGGYALDEYRPKYGLILRLDDDTHTLAVTETIDYTNRTGETLEDIVLQTWLNAFETEETSPAALEEIYDACYPEGFSPGYMTLHDVLWNGEARPYEYGNRDRTALKIHIPSLKDGEAGQITLRFLAHIPHCAYRTGYSGGKYQLGNVIPLLARFQDGAWQANAYSPVGDPFVSDCADFDLTLYLPEGMTPACSAKLEQAENGAWRGQILSSRDVAICLYTDGKLAEGKIGNTEILSYADTASSARQALDFARKALQTFQELYGEYPYPSFSLCQVDFPFGGMEYPALVMLPASVYQEGKKDSMELVIAHETAHQWFYALVGSDQYDQPWQDEALCEYCTLQYVKKRYGQGSFDALKYYRAEAPMRESVPGKLTPGSPVDYFGNLTDYSTVVYGRGCAMLLALDELTAGGVNQFLREYVKNFAFGFAARQDFESALCRRFGMDAGPLMLDYLDTAM